MVAAKAKLALSALHLLAVPELLVPALD